MLAITKSIKSKSRALSLSFIGVLLLSLVFISTFVISSTFILKGSQAHAEASDSENTETAIEVAQVLNISSPSTISLSCNPGTTSAELCTNNASVVVTTNNLTGYTLQMNATSGSSNSLTNTAASPAATIPTLSQAYSSANFPVNYWGYTGGLDKSSESGGYNCASNYCPILAYQSTASNYAPNHTIKVTDAPASASATNLTFAGKVNTDKPSGTYSTSVTFTAVANYIPTPITDGMNMQDITTESCALTSAGTNYTVIDSRDNEEYLVAKLADDNCWMLDNLRLDLTNSTTLNALTTSNTNADSASLISLKSGNRNAGNQYASSGFITWAQGDTANVFNQAKANADYKNTVPSVTYGSGSGKIGVYYNYCAASAGNYCYNQGTGTGNAQYDICPYNWHMPIGGPSGEYDTLYDAYSSDYINFRNALSTPLSGRFGNGTVYLQGSSGYLWSSTQNSTNNMYLLYVISDRVDPSNASDNRFMGYSVRCLIPGA